MSERKCHTNKISLLFPCLTSFILGRNLLIIPFIKAKYIYENEMNVLATPLYTKWMWAMEINALRLNCAAIKWNQLWEYLLYFIILFLYNGEREHYISIASLCMLLVKYVQY